VDDERLANRLATGLTRLAAALDANAVDGPEADPGDRTVAEQQVLLVLARRGPTMTVQRLAGLVGMTEQVTLAVLGALIAKGLATLGPTPSYSPAEARVELTRSGRELPPDLLNWAGDLLGRMDRLPEGERRALLDEVLRQIAQLQRERAIPVTRMCLTCRYFRPHEHIGQELPHHCQLVDAAFGYRELRLRCPDQQPPAAA
jgi:hypothetical protein